MSVENVIDPDVARKANTIGMEALRAGQIAEAITAFQDATSADPAAGPLWRNLAHARRLAGDVAGEQTALEQALAVDRTDFVAQLRMAQLLQRIGEETRALLAWNTAQQFAQALPDLAPAIAAELADGALYCDKLRAKLYAATETVRSTAATLDETAARRISAFVDSAQGRRPVFQNHCAGAYYPFLPQDEFFDRKHFAWFDELEASADIIQAELAALLVSPGDLLRPYVQMDAGTPDNDWTALDGSLDWAACFLWEYGQPNTPVLDRCPQTAALLERLPLARIPGRAPNAFFSMLRPTSHIPPHTGVTNTRAIIHLALDIPPNCGFRVGGETRQWIAGRAFAFDDTIEHEAWNNSDKRRAVLILDAWNPHLSEDECTAISTYFDAADHALAGSVMR
jgi:aspartate beta-hydroxylase